MADPANRFSGFTGDPVVRVGQLRWPVIVARRREEFDGPGGIGIDEDWVALQTVRADVAQVSALTFWMMAAKEQVDTPITHRITCRWLDFLDNTYVIARNTNLPGGGVRGELFRVRRVKELGGRKRYISIDAELERVYPTGITPPVLNGPGLVDDFGVGLEDDFGHRLDADATAGSFSTGLQQDGGGKLVDDLGNGLVSG